MAAGELNIWLIILESGFVVMGVLISLILASIVSWAIIFKKKKTYNRLRKNNKDFSSVMMTSSSLDELSHNCGHMPFSPFKTLFEEGYREYSLLKEKIGDTTKLQEHFQRVGMTPIERGLKKGVNIIDVELEASSSTLASISSLTPFIGLFGTVWGIIDSFTGIASGGATLDAVAPGIAEALVATAVGLIAAIPALWFFNKFSRESAEIHGEMDSFGQDFLNKVQRDLIR